MYGHFACMYVCVQHGEGIRSPGTGLTVCLHIYYACVSCVCQVHKEAIRGFWILNTKITYVCKAPCGCWLLGAGNWTWFHLGAVNGASSAFNHWAHLSSPNTHTHITHIIPSHHCTHTSHHTHITPSHHRAHTQACAHSCTLLPLSPKG